METGAAIYKLLKDSTAVGDICADRIYPELAQQDADTPFIVYTVTDTTPSPTKNATSKLDTARVELYCVGGDYEELMDLGIAVRGALDRQGGTISDVQVQSIQFDTSDIQYDPDQSVYVLEQTYDVRVQLVGTAVSPTLVSNLLTVEELDGSPTGSVNKLVFSNGTVTITNNTATIESGGGGVTSVNTLTGDVELYADNLYLEDGSATTIFGKFTSVNSDLSDIFDILKGDAGTELGVFSDPADNTAASLKVTATSAFLRGGTGTLISAEQTSPGTLTFAVAAGATDTETTVMTIAGQANGNTITTVTNTVRMSGATIQFSNAAGTVTFGGATSGISYNDLDDLPASVGVTYHDRYSTEAESERSGATATLEIYYTARPDGDGYAESEVSDTGVTDTINRTLYYSTKFQADPDTAGDWTEYTTQPADNATFATAKAALLAGLNETDATAETRGTLPLSLKMTRTTTAVSPDLLLDTYTGAAAAYSVRKLDKDYTGSCMRIRRSSDEATQDIGFDSNGDVDQSSIQSFCTGADCYVSIWYDQSGNSNHASQTVANDQPKIYDRLAGAVTTKNGQPILTFADGSDHLDTSTVSLSGPHTAFACAYNQNSFNAQVSWMYHSSGNYLWVYAQNKVQIQSGSEYVGASGSYGDNSAIISCVINGSSTISRGKNSVEEQTNTGTVTSRTITSIRLGSATSGRETDVQEWILWNGAKDSTDRAAIETNINDYFSIY